MREMYGKACASENTCPDARFCASTIGERVEGDGFTRDAERAVGGDGRAEGHHETLVLHAGGDADGLAHGLHPVGVEAVARDHPERGGARDLAVFGAPDGHGAHRGGEGFHFEAPADERPRSEARALRLRRLHGHLRAGRYPVRKRRDKHNTTWLKLVGLARARLPRRRGVHRRGDSASAAASRGVCPQNSLTSAPSRSGIPSSWVGSPWESIGRPLDGRANVVLLASGGVLRDGGAGGAIAR